MTTATLDEIKAEQSRLAEMISRFEQQAREATSILFPEALIELASNEHYAGLLIGKEGAPSYHLILLPGQAEDINWEDAGKWAINQGGELPTRREQSLLFANLKEQFDDRAYWSCEPSSSDPSCAWYQGFDDGIQIFSLKSYHLRARAVRRLLIQ